MSVPTNKEIGHTLRRIRQDYLGRRSLEALADELRHLVDAERGPTQPVSRSALSRRETGRIDLELSTLLLILSLKGLRLMVVNDQGIPLPGEYQFRSLSEEAPNPTSLLTAALNLQLDLDVLLRAAAIESLD